MIKSKNYFILYIIILFLNSCLSTGSYLENRYISISEKVLPSVVEIISVGIDDVSTEKWKDFFQDQEDYLNEEMNTGVGSGVIVDGVEGSYFILTNKHVVGNLDSVSVLLQNNEIIDGVVVGFDDRFDIAVVKIDTDIILPIAKVSLEGNLKVGQFVAVLGSPMSYVQSVSMGIISNIGRFGGPKDNLSNYIQTDAAINHGNSGGPLVNMKGEVIGINTWISSPSSGNIGLGFAMPIENLYPSYRSLVDNGVVEVGWVGVSSYGIPNTEYYKDNSGAFINQVVLNSPAYYANIRPGDIITSLNNQKIKSSEELFLKISMLKPKDIINIKLIRNNTEENINVTLNQSLDSVLETSKKVFPGFILGQRDDNIVILQLLSKSIGLSSGFLKNDILVSNNGSNIKSINEFYKSLIKGVNRLIISRDGKDLELELNY